MRKLINESKKVLDETLDHTEFWDWVAPLYYDTGSHPLYAWTPETGTVKVDSPEFRKWFRDRTEQWEETPKYGDDEC